MQDIKTVNILGKSIYLKGNTNNLSRVVSRLLWFSYRANFPKILPTNIVTDSGWGCTIRTAQMLFANVMIIHKYGKGCYNLYTNSYYILITSRSYHLW